MNFEDVVSKAIAFRDERDWRQFHNAKDLAISINLEASELLELFQWSGDDLEARHNTDAIKDELADVVIYCAYLADHLGVDLAEIMNEKIEANAKKYPVERSKGSSRKYTEL